MRDKVRSVWSHVAGCRNNSRELDKDTDDTLHSAGAQLRVGSSRNWWDFLVRRWHGAPKEGSGLMSMQPIGCTPWYSMCAVVVVVNTLLSNTYWTETTLCGKTDLLILYLLLCFQNNCRKNTQ